MKKALIFLSTLMIVSFALSAMFFFNSGVFDFNYGYVTGENARSLNLDLSNFFSEKFGGENCELDQINQTLVFDKKSFDNIKISSISTDVKLIPTDENKSKFILKGTGCNQRLNYSLDSNSLNVNIIYPIFKSWVSKINTNLVLEVYLPENYTKNISISSVSGDINLDDNKFLYCDVNSVSGDLKLENIYCNDANIKTTSGDINLETGKLNKFKTTSGDINLEKIIIKNDLDIKTISGDVKIIPDIDSEFKVVFNTISGEFHEGNSYTLSDNVVYVKTTSGDLRIL